MCYDTDMKSAPLEPGILNIFRFSLVIQLILVLVNVAAHTRHAYLGNDPGGALIFGGISIVLLLGYLSWPWLQKKLGKLYLPIALIFSATFSLALQNIFLNIRLSAAEGSSEEAAWTLFLFLFIPLVLVAWQYNFKAVVAYTLYTLVLDHTLMNLAHVEYYTYADTHVRLLLIRGISFFIAGYAIARIMRQFRQQRDALRQANRELAHYAATLEQLTVSRERNRMARELHDILAHTLSGIAVQLEAVESLWGVEPEEAHVILGKSLAATRSGLTETRRALQALRASPLEDMGLELALHTLAKAAAERVGLNLDWQVPDRLPKLPSEMEQCLYRVVQEAFENIVRHASASRVQVGWALQDGLFKLSISDDGCGFSPLETADGSHYGLRGMQERASMLGGEVQVVSQPGQGTTICLKGRM